MATQSSRLKVEQDGDVSHVRFVDRNILEEAVIAQIGDEIAQLVDQTNSPRVLLDFSNVEHLSSAALGQLITINSKVKRKGGQLRLSDINSQIYEVFVITRLDTMFQIFDDSKKALASFK